jgi:hypothetical protein
LIPEGKDGETYLSYGENGEDEDFCQRISDQLQMLEEDCGNKELNVLLVYHFVN